MPMVSEGDCVAIFNSIHRVMKAEKLLKERRIPVLLIPAPRALHADCGLALRYGNADRDVVEQALAEGGIVLEDLYMMKGGQYVKLREGGADLPTALSPRKAELG